MAHCSIVGCKNKQANKSEFTYFSLPKDPQRRKSWLAAISRDKSNLPSNILVSSDHFEDKYFDKTWDLQNWFQLLFQHYYYISKYQHLGKLLRLDQAEGKRRGKTLKQVLDIINLTGFQEVLI